MRTHTLAALAATLILSLAGCGGDDKKTNRDAAYKPPSASPQAVAEAKSTARNATSLIESCYVDTQDYSQCKPALTEGGLKVGTAPGQVNVTAATPSSYRIEAYSEGGGTFAVVKDEGGAMKRTCSGAGCEGDTW